MDMEDLYLITDKAGFTPEMSRLISMMNYARYTTMKTVEGLSQAQLDYVMDPHSNSIGALLYHMAAVEYAYQAFTFENRELSEQELLTWGAALELGEKGQQMIHGHDLNFYLTLLDEVRQRTLDGFKSRNDEWLHEAAPFWHGKPANNYFKWFHVFEDEINHRGQMRFIKKRLPQNL